MYVRLFLLFALACSWWVELLGLKVVAVLMLVAYLLTGGKYTIYLAYHTTARDLRAAIRYLRLLSTVFIYQKRNMAIPHLFQKIAKTNSDKVCLYYQEQSWTFKYLDEYSNRVASFMIREGFKHGDSIALIMENRPEYVGLWLGCTKLGVVPALINTNLRGVSLLHSINAASCIAVIYGTELTQAVSEIQAELQDNLRLYSSGETESGESEKVKNNCLIDPHIEKESSGPLPQWVQKSLNFRDKLLYIYTSGTTGLPKAAVVRNSRFYFYVMGIYYMNAMYNLKKLVFYNPLPLYHSAGGVVGVGLMMGCGATVVLRKKFSVRNFWKDCIKYDCNGAQYIGEICRYLLSVPESVEDRQHGVEIMWGNGLRPHIWTQFSQRFGIYRIGEFYGATEGNSNVVNTDCKTGAVGFTSVLFPWVYPVSLIRITEQGNVLRGEDGLCIKCKAGEPGEFVGKIVKGSATKAFDGYIDKKATEKKIVRDVLSKGDMYFRSGDLLYADEFGWMYFMDRMGDTFRWRGENVSTIEVESVISNATGQTDSIVYGVEVPGAEGKAGMAAIVETTGHFDLDIFLTNLRAQLPSYAIPLFVRLVESLDITGTFKIRKMDFQREGYNPMIVQDPLYFYNSSQGGYCKLDVELYSDILEEKCLL